MMGNNGAIFNIGDHRAIFGAGWILFGDVIVSSEPTCLGIVGSQLCEV